MPRLRSTFAFVFITIFALLITPTHTGAQVARATLTMGSGTGTPSGTITVPVTLTNLKAVAGLQFTVVDTPNVVDVDTIVVAGRAQTAGFSLQFNRDIHGSPIVLMYIIGTNTIPPGIGPVAQITFRVHPDAPSGSALVRLNNVVLADTNNQAIPVTDIPGLLTITGGQPLADTTPPAAPQSLTALPDSRRVALSWSLNTESDLAYYVLYRSLTDGFTPTGGDSIARPLRFQTAHTDTGLTNGTPYYYKLVAVDFAGNA